MKRWSVIEVLDWTTKYFIKKGISNPRLDAEVLLSEVLKCSRLEIYLNYSKPLTEDELAFCHQLVKRRSSYEPIAYIIGRKEFYGYGFIVNPSVLIPRPETELLVEEIVKKLKTLDEKKPYTIVDVGTGSGNIATALAKSLDSYIYAIDTSTEILDIASQNAKNLGVKDKINFLKGNLLAPLKELNLVDKIDVIVSNPPYIPTNEINNLSPDIKNYEPLVALDGGIEGTCFQIPLIKESLTYLKKGGYLYLELGVHQFNILKEVCHELKSYSHVEAVKDYDEVERILKAQKG